MMAYRELNNDKQPTLVTGSMTVNKDRIYMHETWL